MRANKGSSLIEATLLIMLIAVIAVPMVTILGGRVACRLNYPAAGWVTGTFDEDGFAFNSRFAQIYINYAGQRREACKARMNVTQVGDSWSATLELFDILPDGTYSTVPHLYHW